MNDTTDATAESVLAEITVEDVDAIERWGATALREHQPGQPDADRIAKMFRRLAASAHPMFGQLESGQSEPQPELEGGGLIDEALEHSSRAYLQALHGTGLPISALALLQSWMDLNMGALALQQRLADVRARRSAPDLGALFTPVSVHRDPIQPLTAVELGRELGNVSDETIRNHEKAGRLFSILRPGRQRGREYPAFQAWSGVAGEPLARTLAALGVPKTADAADAYGFFTSKNDLLADLTPIEVLIGSVTATRELSGSAADLLGATAADRLSAVEEAAKAYAAQVEA